MMSTTLLVPGDPIDPRTPDEHFAPEHAAALAAGHATCLLDDTALPGRAALRHPSPDVAGSLTYRGWMLTAPQYQQLADAAALHGLGLRVTPPQYERAHHLPGWHALFADLTPASRWTTGPDVDAALTLLDELGAAAVVAKDYVKSVKHLWHEACLIPDTGDRTHARRVLERLAAERDDLFQGGFVVRAYEPLSGAEARSWWRDGQCVLLTAHPDTPDTVPADVPVHTAAEAVAALEHPLVTVDWAQRADGVWRVIEVGDAQVSDRPRSTSAAVLVDALLG